MRFPYQKPSILWRPRDKWNPHKITKMIHHFITNYQPSFNLYQPYGGVQKYGYPTQLDGFCERENPMKKWMMTGYIYNIYPHFWKPSYIWLVVWLPCFIFPYIGLLSSSQLTFIFFKGVETTNQIFNLGIQQLQILSISYAAGDLDCFVSHSSWISMELHRGRRSVVFSVGGGA